MVLLAALEGWLAALSAAVEHGNALLCSRWVTALQVHGIVPGLLLGTLWVLAGRARLQELRRQQRRARERRLASLGGAGAKGGGGTSSKLGEQEAGVPPQPAVTVVLPVRGCRLNTMANWRSVLALEYGGELDFLFVLEDKSDPAAAVIAALQRERRGGAGGERTLRTLRTAYSGQASCTSQKIHNLLAGIRGAAPGSKYVLCLDDDVQLHPGVLGALVADMEADPSLFMATGYPFDVPPLGAGLLAYAALSYHLPLIIPFSVRQRTQFVWGGCMLLRAGEMRADTHGILQAWGEGGYSDDLTVASKCTEQGLVIYCPSYSIFPQWLDGDYSLRQWWNYLRRQLYVLDTYSNAHNRRTNHAMALLHCYGSWGFVLPAVTASLRMLLWAAAVVLLPTQQVYGGPDSSAYLWLRAFGVGHCPWALASWLAFAGFTTYMLVALRWMTGVILELFCALNPELRRQQLQTFCWPKLLAGFVLSNAVIPMCMTYTFLTRHIDWSGIRYYRHGGRVVRVQHSLKRN